VRNYKRQIEAYQPPWIRDQKLRRELPPDAALEHAKIVREMIRHEDDIINQSFTWLCQIQGFLFAALAFVWKEPTADYLILLLCLVGYLVPITTWYSLRAVSIGIGRLLNWWDINKPANYSGPPVYAREAGLVGWDYKKFLRPWFFLPLIFGLVWIVVFIIRFWNNNPLRPFL